jgi:nucleotide-binding universal stress UspA family protein
MFDKVLVAFDGKNQGVIKFINRLPQCEAIYVLSVVELSFAEKILKAFHKYVHSDESWMPGDTGSLSKKLELVSADLAVAHKKVYKILHAGDPYQEIKKVIDETHPDLVVVGKSKNYDEISFLSKKNVETKLAASSRSNLVIVK